MKVRGPHLWIALFSALGVAFVAVVGVERTSPGPLSAVHEREAELSGGRSCSECHGGWGQSMAGACLQCHAEIDTQIDASKGLHGAIAAQKARACATCHSEHHGPGFQSINRQSFVQAGVRDPQEFDHGLVGFAMDGAHLELDCTECHANADERVLPKGERRFGGLDQDCAQCHGREDPHEGLMQVSCAQCHGQQAFDQLGSLGHERHLPLLGGHADQDCRVCHARGESHSLEIMGSPRPPPARACADCHDSPHDADFISGAAAFARATPAASCVDCHAAEHTSFLDGALTMSPELHALSGFALDAPHDGVDCQACHGPDNGDFRARYPGRDADTCSACHDDPHAGQFDGPAFADQGCTACHDRLRFEPHAYTIESHASASMALSGAHAETDCNACHGLPVGGGARVFHGTPGRCEACHGDAHDGFFDAFSAELAGRAGGECATCHHTTRFADVQEKAFDHGRWTHFPLLGAHAQSDCESCHPRQPKADDLGRSFGRVEQHFGSFEGCVTCHDDPHHGDFDKPGSPPQVGGSRTCARCHAQTSFRAFPEGFDHELWTRFPLDGAHAQVGCSACHAPQRAEQSGARSLGRAMGRACADCHADPHAGQFRENGTAAGRTDCSRCHRDTASFATLAFDHDKHARFALEDAHAALPCSSCHKTWEGADGSALVQYRPLGTECTDCHGVHDDPLRRRRGRNP
jgi:hypothetical protein